MKCENCGNDYDKPMKILTDGKSHIFDCFECAIAQLAPCCEHCKTRIIGHGVESRGRMFCCAHCANMAGISELTDRV